MPRKASPQRKSVELDRPRAPVALIAVVVLTLAATAGAIAWGRSDSGAINVSATIAASQPQNEEGGGAPVGIATNEHSALPNGGLEAQGGDAPLAPQPEVVPEVLDASTTATTTESSEVPVAPETQTDTGEGSTEETSETTEEAPAPEVAQ